MPAFVNSFTPSISIHSSDLRVCRRGYQQSVFRYTSRCSLDTPTPELEESAMTAAAATFVLKRAADSYTNGTKRQAAATVSGALLALEKEQRKNKVKCDIAELLGQWRLIFVANPKSSNPFSRAYYFPLRAHQTFTSDDDTNETGIFDNGVFLLNGALSMRLSGPFRWVSKRNRLEFTVDRMKLKGGSWENIRDGLDKEGSSLDGRTSKTLPFFTFFLITPGLAAARGRSGGLAFYSRVPIEEHL